MLITITQADIDHPDNTPGDEFNSPTIRALERLGVTRDGLPPTSITVGDGAILWFGDREASIALPDVVNRHESEYDSTGTMKPYGFQLPD